MHLGILEVHVDVVAYVYLRVEVGYIKRVFFLQYLKKEKLPT